ncbi:hypothetical protein GCK32_019110 [Trichostrongylus colubriformis]|uniref:Uncharacterized protein n=1 Tax=Trichostrongylus colubriformis TaxID=6319 RepID=A0AAN8FTS4_TRICO
MATTTFNLPTAKGRLTRELNRLSTLHEQFGPYNEPWTFPTDPKELETFLITNKIQVQDLMQHLDQLKTSLWDYYTQCNTIIQQVSKEDSEEGTILQTQLDQYWKDKRDMWSSSAKKHRSLEKTSTEMRVPRTQQRIG